MPHTDISEKMMGIDLDSEKMVPVPDLDDEKTTYSEQTTALSVHHNLEDITGVDNQTKGVNPIVIKTSL